MPDSTVSVKTPALLRPGQLAQILGVSAETITAWAIGGRIPTLTLPSGHRRYDAAAVAKRLREQDAAVPEELAVLAGEEPPRPSRQARAKARRS